MVTSDNSNIAIEIIDGIIGIHETSEVVVQPNVRASTGIRHDINWILTPPGT